jgi:RNA polymerase sigma factor (sigma-70 family)
MSLEDHAAHDSHDDKLLAEFARLTAQGADADRRREIMGELIAGWARLFTPWLVLRTDSHTGNEIASRVMERLVRLLVRKQRFEHPWGKVVWATVKFELRSVHRETRRRRERETSVPEPYPDADAEPTYEPLIDAEEGPDIDVARLRRALAMLSDRDRRIIELIYFKNASRADAAAQLGIKPGTFSVAKLRALERLREAYEHLDVSDGSEAAGI